MLANWWERSQLEMNNYELRNSRSASGPANAALLSQRATADTGRSFPTGADEQQDNHITQQ